MSEMPSLTSQRHRDNLTKCVRCMRNYLDKISINNNINNLNNKAECLNSNLEQDLALIAEELRMAIKWLGSITGHVTSENILDVIFKDFCIGK